MISGASVPDLRRFVELMADLAADERDGTRTRVPVIGDSEAVLLAGGLQREVDKHAAARQRRAAEQGLRIACALGCTACCENVVIVYRPEAVLIADWLRRPERGAERDRFLADYPRWRRELGDDLQEFHRLHAHGDRDAAEAFYGSLRRHRALCAFNCEGACAVYDVRPIVCRNTMALNTADYCEYDNPAGRGPAFLSFAPMDEVVERCRALLRVAHQRMQGAQAPVAVCQAVRELLTGLSGTRSLGHPEPG